MPMESKGVLLYDPGRQKNIGWTFWKVNDRGTSFSKSWFSNFTFRLGLLRKKGDFFRLLWNGISKIDDLCYEMKFRRVIARNRNRFFVNNNNKKKNGLIKQQMINSFYILAFPLSNQFLKVSSWKYLTMSFRENFRFSEKLLFSTFGWTVDGSLKTSHRKKKIIRKM